MESGKQPTWIVEYVVEGEDYPFALSVTAGDREAALAEAQRILVEEDNVVIIDAFLEPEVQHV